MTIRTKLTLAISGLLAGALGLLAWGVLAVSDSFARRDAAQRTAIIENSVERAGRDALLQKDDLLLISYVNFLREQYPALTSAEITWFSGDKPRTIALGSPTGAEDEERVLQVSDPADPSRRVSIRVALDLDLLEAQGQQQKARLTKIMLMGLLGTTLLAVLLSFWFAGTLAAPLRSMVALASEISSGKLGARLEWDSDDELGALVRAFNAMSHRLEELDETKKNFVSSVTHELRSPLGAIESFLHLIEERPQSGLKADKEGLEYFGRIQANVRRLSGFINDLLDVAKIEKGKMECVLRPMKLQDVAAEVCQFFEAKAKQQNVALQNRLNGAPAVLGDPDRLRQVLVNLIANGLKFTPPGGRIELSAEQFREGSGRWVEVAVRDTGRGMDQSDVARLFRAFSQGRNIAEGVVGHKGTGLGLFITKSIIDQHGGKIDVRSLPGKGTQITFSLKAAA